MKPRKQPQVWQPVPEGPVQNPVRYEEALRRKRAHYDGFDLHAFEQRLTWFEELDFQDPGIDLVKAVDHVIRDPVTDIAISTFSWDEVPVGTLLWRARQMTAETLKEGHITVSDLWEPPATHATSGRFNGAGEPVLYACIGTPLETLKEARITDPDVGFMLIGYEVRAPIPLRRVGVTNPDDGLALRQQELETRVSQFLAEVVSYPAVEYGPDAYAHTRRLLREFYSLESGWECGWIYGSVLEGPRLINVALGADHAHSRLGVYGVVAGRVGQTDTGDIGVYLAGFSDGVPRFGEHIRFADFPHDEFSTLQEYFDYLSSVALSEDSD